MKVRGFFLRSLLSFLFCALIPAGLILFLNTAAESDARQQWITHHNTLLHQQGKAADDKIEELRNLIYGINMDARYQTLIYQQAETIQTHALEIYQVRNDMAQRVSAQVSLRNIYLYCSNSGMVLSNMGKADSPRQFQEIYMQDAISYPEWMHLLEEVSQDRLFYVGGRLYYAQSLLIQERRSPTATLLFELDTTALLPDSPDAFLFAAMNADNQIVSADPAADAVFGQARYQSLPAGQPALIAGNLLFAVDSRQSGWKYLLAVPESAYQQTRAGAKRLFVHAELGCLAVFGIFSVFFSFWRTRSLRRLWKELRLGESGERLDYNHLRQYVLRLHEDNRTFTARLTQQSADQTRFLLLRLLSGWTESASQARLLARELGFPEERNWMAVVLLRFEDRQDGKEPGGLAARCETIEKLIAALLENDLLWLSPLPAEDTAACLLLFQEREDLQGYLSDCAQKLLHEMRVEQRLRVTISYSMPTQVYPEEVSRLFAEAKRAMRGRTLQEEAILTVPSSQTALPVPARSAGSLKRLSTLLEARKLEEAREEVRLAMETVLSWTEAPERAQIRLLSIADQVLNLLESPAPVQQQAVLLPCVQRLLEGEHIARTGEYLDELLNFCALEPEELHRETNVQAVLRYIEEHYADSNLTVASLAGLFDCDPTTLTKSVKQHTGVPVLQYIHQVRIRHAKELMLTTGSSIRDTAAAVGYVSDITFIRAFKKLESVTPGQFVKQHVHREPDIKP